MTRRERFRLRLLRAAQQGRLGRREAAARLGVSACQLRRLLRRLAAEGDRVVIHGLEGRPGNRGAHHRASGLRQRVRRLSALKYAGHGPVRLAKGSRQREGLHVARETLRRWLVAAGLR
ncbi:MAG: hypothetical protein KatS3mg102_1303 [Planctomycetota bacterium]|nr:MAG: hypothetical protein KatS3mg102_1303 [Planctomycetota bacterium]